MYSDFDSFIQSHNTQVSGGKYRVRRFSTPFGARRELDVSHDREKEGFDLLRRVLSNG
jgi:hypothetical protein